ncbi:MAG: hypothetical protein KME15_14345 [Drouetiella hepatica Uher 2000/2452]|uniref:Uncharacterized protein n=1 Tax=Drouetiella hepatica Uher 2000/2452 TaxID=904376 RepID=A0A951QBP1_9CYAN|nr:hypothetical protein [Drouetiella hepatica Uher 2000/2452]
MAVASLLRAFRVGRFAPPTLNVPVLTALAFAIACIQINSGLQLGDRIVLT